MKIEIIIGEWYFPAFQLRLREIYIIRLLNVTNTTNWDWDCQKTWKVSSCSKHTTPSWAHTTLPSWVNIFQIPNVYATLLKRTREVQHPMIVIQNEAYNGQSLILKTLSLIRYSGDLSGSSTFGLYVVGGLFMIITGSIIGFSVVYLSPFYSCMAFVSYLGKLF